MKRFGNLILLSILTLCFFACEEPTLISPIDTSVRPSQLITDSFEAEITIAQSYVGQFRPVGLRNELNVEFRGDGNSNLLSNVTLIMSHTESHKSESANFSILDGEFVIRSESGEEISGTYIGHGALRSQKVEIYNFYQEWLITGGTGRFVNASGQLFAQIDNYQVDIDNFNEWNPMKMNISGDIVLSLEN